MSSSSSPEDDLFAEFMRRVDAGEELNFEEWVKQYPELETQLRAIHAGHRAIDIDFATMGAGQALARRLARLAQRKSSGSRYRIEGELARGGMGAIMRVWDEDLNRYLAMKIVLDSEEAVLTDRTRLLARFLEEADLTGQLDHPGIVPVHELGLDARGRAFFTMKLVKGQTFKQIIDLLHQGEDGWTLPRALGLLLKVCEAVAYAHAKGVIHRDLKPANIMVGKFGEVYVMDWGLARVLGKDDLKDTRIRPESTVPLTKIHTARRAHAESDPESPLYTMDGDVVGTPAYMPPEQARGEVAMLDRRSDVYSLGAMLYHLVTGTVPYVRRGTRASPHTILRWVIEGPPPSLHQLAPDVPPELESICSTAMARDVEQRYPDVQALAEDLHAFLEGRVVRAYRTGALAELGKWIRRNRRFAAALAGLVVVLIGGLFTSLYYAEEATEKAKLAGEREREAITLKNVAIEREHELRVRGLIQDLAAFETLDDTLDYARHQDRAAFQWWMERARLLIRGRAKDPTGRQPWLPGLAEARAQLANLRTQAFEATPAEREFDQRFHPLAEKLAIKRSKLGWYDRMLGLQPWPDETEVEARLPAHDLDRDSGAGFKSAAWVLLDPTAPWPGNETKSLVLARRSLSRADEEQRARVRATLAQALFCTGRFDEALAEAREALSEADAVSKTMLSAHVSQLEESVDRWQGGPEGRRLEREALAVEVEALEQETHDRRTWHFVSTDLEWWHGQLKLLVDDLERLEQRISLVESTVWTSLATARWNQAIAAISVSPRYGGLQITPQIGLIPIGPDPDSGLWEFSHLQSGEIATRAADGRLVLRPEMGLVFVLLPGGRVPVEDGCKAGPIHQVDLDFFFISKYEMTIEQWEMLSPWSPPSWAPKPPMTPAHNVSWDDCTALLRQLDAWISLPTEAQWEYACRAGTRTIWWTGDLEEDLRGAANTVLAAETPSGLQPVGRLRANPFGLHDVHGNLWEWCRDAFGLGNDPHRPGDGFRDIPGASFRVIRGGGSLDGAADGGSSRRYAHEADTRLGDDGLRPVRGIAP